MSRSSLRTLILGVAIAVLSAWYGLEQFLPEARPAEAEAAIGDVTEIDQLGSELALSGESAVSQAELDQRRLLAAAPWPADPFFRLAVREGRGSAGEQTAVSTTPRFVLSATTSADQPLAIINGRVLSAGDRLEDGSLIIAIEDHLVKLQGPQGPWILKLAE